MRRHALVVAGLVLFAGTFAQAEIIELEGTVTAVDAEARSVVIERNSAAGGKSMTMDVAPSAGDLKALKPGTVITFSFDNKLEVVTAIETGNEGEQLFVAGSEWVTEDGSLRIRVIHVDGDAFVGLMYGTAPVLRELHGEIKGNKVSWLAKNTVALKGKPGHDNFGRIRRGKQGARIDVRHGEGDENETETITFLRVEPKPQKSK